MYIITKQQETMVIFFYESVPYVFNIHVGTFGQQLYYKTKGWKVITVPQLVRAWSAYQSH